MFKRRKILIIIFLLNALLIPYLICAQSPQKISYQAIVRDPSNHIIANQDISIRISILTDSIDGQVCYLETHNPKSNSTGIVQINIGDGTAISGKFTSVPWNNQNLYVKTEMDFQGGNNYNIFGTTRLVSVPYSLYTSDIHISKSGDTVVIGNSKILIPGAQLLKGQMPSKLNDGLIAYYPFNGNANDESGNNYNGTVNGPTLTADRFGNPNKAYSFKSSPSIQNITTSLIGPIGQEARTISFWIKQDISNSTNDVFVLCSYGDNTQSGADFTPIISPNNEVGIDILGGNIFYSKITIGTWIHYAAVYDPSFGKTINSIKVYLNGILQNKTLDGGSLIVNTGGRRPFIIGDPNADQNFIGKIDDLRVYSRALTQEEISYLYSN